MLLNTVNIKNWREVKVNLKTKAKAKAEAEPVAEVVEVPTAEQPTTSKRRRK